MDPEITYSELREALATGDQPAAVEHARNLRDWFDKGGFVPDGAEELWLPAGMKGRGMLVNLAHINARIASERAIRFR